MGLGQTLPLSCGHTSVGHVFQHAFCSHQSMFKRVTTVAAASLFLVAAVFAVYSLVSKYISNSPVTRQIDSAIFRERASTDPAVYPTIGQLAFNEANELLEENPNIAPFKFTSSKAQTHQPINTPIPYLMKLFEQKYWPAFQDAFKQAHDNASTRYHRHAEIVGKEHVQLMMGASAGEEAAFKCMKIAYVISCLTLEDLKPFTERFKGTKDERTPLQALVRQDSYQYQTCFLCSKVYHMIRGGLIWNGNDFVYPKELPTVFAESFYRGSSLRYEWNLLYNDFCTRIALHVDKDELGNVDGRFVNWTREDKEGQYFAAVPDTLPT